MSTSTRSLAAASGASFVGAMVSAGAGFLLTLVLGRTLGPGGAGVVLQTIGVLTIAVGVGKVGLDTTAIWLLPRTRADEPAAVRGVVRGLLVAGFCASLVVAGVLALLAPWLFAGPGSAQVLEAVRATAWFLPAAVVATVGLAATRGLGGIGPYTLIGSIAVPGSRPLLVLVVGALGGGAVAAAVSWVAVLAVALVPVALVLRSRVRRVERAADVGAALPLERAVVVRAARFTLPRSLSSAIELAQQWLDVILVGALAGPAAAGVYGAATRFVAAGMVPSTSLRVVVAPQFSAALHAGDTGTAEDVYRRTTSWIVLLSLPVYALLALFGGTVLSLLGPEFRAGAALLPVLGAGAAISVMTGNVQSLLLMSGRSGWVAVNKAVVLAVLVIGLVAAIPLLGLPGAALAWAVAATTDAALASTQVSRLLRIRLELGVLATAFGASAVPYLVAGGVARWWLGDSVEGLVVGAAVGSVLFVAATWALRGRLDVQGAFRLLRRRGGGTPREETR
ncbi:oligosaccharide flippase family protein [Cellulomonas sp. APG4]|uniref:lipopolysaccharide biosynthesis protein n=1 Tax=Cellulomonas sp. APG4 TaxID=1538656 RepID=UPI00137B710A|nr:oligosaccharide flippase family protein [Cellulomonas sp. APG4]